ncbi:vacuolar protein sorting-associated protein 41 like protein, partial [Quercus suber]
MAPIPSENGVEGDDEREEEDDDEEEEEEEEEEAGEEEEEEEEEPRLKYQRMGGSIPTLLASDTASCIAVKEFPAHTAAVNDLSFDIEGEYVGSCSDDGSVVINSLFTDEKLKFEYHRPMKAIALDPDYSRKTSRRFVTGGLAGHLYYNTKKWFGYRDQVLHSGEGPIHVVKWRTSLVAWANDAGVKVYDTANDQRITFIERPRGSPRPELLLPHLVWQDDALLVIGWGTSVKIASIRTNQNRATNGTYMHVPMSSANKVDIVASFQTSYFISGVAPFGDSLVVLAYILGEEDGEKEFSSTIPSRQGNAQRPEVRIVSWNNDELSTDALPVHGFEHYKAKDYSLAHAPFSGSSYAGGQWAAGDEPLYYIVSPKDVVIAKPRDAEDHIAWLLQHGWHEKALAAVEAGQGRSELLDELPVLVPYMPTDNPRLRDTAYEVALVALATNSSFHKELLSTVKSWPHVIYSALPVISAIEPQLNTSSMTDALKEALAELYVIDGQYEKAFSIYADLMKPEVFDFIEKHNLQDAIQEKVVQLMTIDCKHAVPLLIQNKDVITPSDVVSQLLNSSNKCDNRYFLHLYLHSLFEVNPHSGKDFHDMQVELYADYDPKMLLPFLRSSQHYTLEKAYETCIRRDLLREQVFILGRMGNSRQALAVIINKLGDIEEAVEFVTMQHDDDLWEELIKQCLNKPEMVGVLLEHTVGNLDPLYIVNMVPNGLEIPRLADCVNLLVKYYKEARHGIYLSNEEEEARAKRNDSSASQEIEKSSMRTTEVKSKTRGGGRCCMCFDPFSIQNVSVIAFFCCHAYHMTCLMDSTSNVSGKKGSEATSREPLVEYEYDNGDVEDDEDDDEDTQSSSRHADCVNLLVKYYKEARHGIYLSNEEEEARAKRNDSSASQEIEKSSMRTTEVKSKTRGGGRCCMCFDPFSIQNVSVIAFFCCHAYHMTCLMDSTSNVSGKKGSEATSREPLVEYEYDNGDVEDDEDDDEDTQSSSRR